MYLHLYGLIYAYTHIYIIIQTALYIYSPIAIIYFMIKERNQLTVNKLLGMFLIKYYLTSIILYEMFNDELFILHRSVYTLVLVL